MGAFAGWDRQLQENASRRLRPPTASSFPVTARHVNSMMFARLHPGDPSVLVSRHVVVVLELQLPFVIVRERQGDQCQPHRHRPVTYLSSGLRCRAANGRKPAGDTAKDANAEPLRFGISGPITTPVPQYGMNKLTSCTQRQLSTDFDCS